MQDEQLGRVMGEVGMIKDMLSDLVKESRKDRAELRQELNDIKSEITRYKFVIKAVVGTIIAVATLRFGDISSLWG